MPTLGILEYFKPGREDERSPQEKGFAVVRIEPLTPEEEIMVYLDYRRTGGAPLDGWERELRRLQKAGHLAVINGGSNELDRD